MTIYIHCMIRNAQFNQEKSLIKILPNLLVTFYFAMLVYTSITNEGLQTNLVTCHLFPMVMTSFNTAASLSLERLVNMHLTICHTLFKTNFHINVNIKRFRLDRGCGTTAGWKTFHLLLGGKPQAHCTTHSMTSWPVSANTSKIKSISKFSRYITIDSHHSHNRSTVSHLQLSWSWTAYTMSFSEKCQRILPSALV